METRLIVQPKKTTCCLFIFVLLAGFSALAHAQQSDQLYETLSKSQLLSIMKEEGYSVSDESERSILWTIEGNPAFLFFYEEIDHVTMFWAGVDSDDTTLHGVNEWNKNNRYIRTYIDDEGDPILEIDLDVEGGVTRERITHFLRTCRQSYVEWYDDCVK